jgi:sugar phosphate isomerase/epimerase
MDWRAFVSLVKAKGFTGPFEIENEALLSKQTGSMAAIVQGCKAAVQNLAPLLWELNEEGWTYPNSAHQPLQEVLRSDIPVVTMDHLL